MKNPMFSINSFISQGSYLKELPSELLEYNNEYERYSGERYNDMVESIKKHGILQPLIVRATDNNKYKILSGNNRKYCGEAAGLTVFPCIIKEGLTDEEAQAYIDETNVFQRGFRSLKLSKQAEVVARRHSMMFDKEKLKSIQREIAALNGEEIEEVEEDESDGEKISKLARVGKEYDLGKTTIARLIRINSLVPDLKKLVDDETTIGVRTAVELSYLSSEMQQEIYNCLIKYDCRLETKKSEIMRKLYKNGELTSEIIEKIILGTYEPDKEEPDADSDNLIPAESAESFDPDLPEPAEINEADVMGTYGKSGDEGKHKEPSVSSRGKSNKDDYDDYDDDDDENDDYSNDEAKPKTIRLSKELIERYFSINSDEATILRTIETALEQYFSSLKP